MELCARLREFESRLFFKKESLQVTLQKTGKNRDSCDSDSRNQYNPSCRIYFDGLSRGADPNVHIIACRLQLAAKPWKFSRNHLERNVVCRVQFRNFLSLTQPITCSSFDAAISSEFTCCCHLSPSAD